MYKRIGFIGLGLIGGSIAKAIKEKRPAVQIIAHASHKETIAEAYNAGVIENMGFIGLSEFADMDIIFLCGPVGVNIEYLKQLAPIISEHTILTDVGSVKGDIHSAVKELGLSDRFIGGHPMTGSEKTGFSNASSLLLENAYYIITSDEPKLSAAAEELSGFVTMLGAIPMRMTPEEHDFATAAVSHLPHVISAALVNLIRKNDGKDEVLRTIAAGGFKDITRISSSSPVMWQHICLANRDKILKLISIYEDELSAFKKTISESDERELMQLFAAAKNYRDSVPNRNDGVLPRIYELYCDLKDEVGGIANVAGILAEQDISIKNIGIVHNREFEDGALRIEFYSETDVPHAIAVLEGGGYTTYHRGA